MVRKKDKFKIQLKGVGFLKSRITRKPRTLRKKDAQRIARLERKRGGFKVRLVKVK